MPLLNMLTYREIMGIVSPAFAYEGLDSNIWYMQKLKPEIDFKGLYQNLAINIGNQLISTAKRGR